MSVSPPIRRLSTNSSSREDLIYQYEAEEERIINILSRKLEQLREEKIELENVLEAESESHVNRLSRELTALRLAQQQQQQQAGPSHVNGGGASPHGTRANGTQLAQLLNRGNGDPTSDMILDALRRENEALRSRLVETEQDFIRISRLNEVYREELIQHRRRLGLPVDSLIGLPQSEPFSQPTHRRASSTSSSPSSSIHVPPGPLRHTTAVPIPHASAVPIPRPPSQIRRPANIISSESTTPLSHSPSSTSTSPFPFSPVTTSPFPASYVSAATNMTTPPSVGSVAVSPPTFTAGGAQMLSYPLVPPPSLSSSFGSPSTSLHQPSHPISFSRDPDGTLSPVESLHSGRHSFNRRGSFERRVAETGSLRSLSRGHSHSRRASVERGARIAETGSLVPRTRSDSFGLPETIEDADPPPATVESGSGSGSG
ncbi:hypothetical protein C8Q76DRAFT_592509, partial [Earliella scabrosa]